MAMHLKPILAALRRHPLMLGLLVTVIALSCAVVSNGVFLLTLRQQRLHMPAGFAEELLLEVDVESLRTDDDALANARSREALDALRRLAHVEAASLANMAPFDSSAAWGGFVALTPEASAAKAGPIAALYAGEDLARTLGLRLVAGRWLDPGGFIDLADFRDGKRRPAQLETLVTQAMARRLWPHGDALGQRFYFQGEDTAGLVVGVVEHLPRSVVGTDEGGDYSVVLPLRAASGRGGQYFLIRVDAVAHRDSVLRAAADTLHRLDPHRVIERQRPLLAARRQQFGKDQAMSWILSGLCLALLLVTGIGIVGLSSYWVQQRRRQIGIRRALGATRGDIQGHFLLENVLLTGLGVILGMGLAYGLSLLLMHYYELPRLPLFYFPLGALALWLTGLSAVLGPALRASAVPPAVAAAG